MTGRSGIFVYGVAACALLASALPAHAATPRATFTLRAAPGQDLGDLESRLRQAIGEASDRELATTSRQRASVERAIELAEDLLRSEGYYGGWIEVASSGEADEENAVQLNRNLVITPGTRFTIENPTIDWRVTRGFRPVVVEQPATQDGVVRTAPPEESEASAVPVREDRDVVDNAFKAMNLPEGAPGRAADIIAAETRVIASLRNDGFADARALDRQVDVVHPASESDVDTINGDDATLADDLPEQIREQIEQEIRDGFVSDIAPTAPIEVDAAGQVTAALPDPSQKYANHPGNVVIPTLRIAPGQLVRMHERILLNPHLTTVAAASTDDAEVRPREATRTHQWWVQRLVTWDEGEIYDPALLAELEKDLTDTGVYNTATVTLQDRRTARGDDPSGLRNVVVTLVDRDHKLLEAGASYATTDGIGLDIFRTHFNRFGRADTLRYGLRLADIDSRIGGEWTRPHFRKRGRTISFSGYAVNEITDAYERQALSFDADISQRRGKDMWFSVGAGLDAGRYIEVRYDPITQQAIDFDRDLVIATLRASARIDRSNDPLDPTEGWRASLSLQPTAVTGEDTVFFLRGVADGSAYVGFGENDQTVLAGRVKIGTIIGGDELIIPSARLMYSGGGGSVRGYSFQSINPRLPDNTPRGGMSLFETSLEVRRDVGRNWQAVGFIDAGAVGFQETPNLTNMRYGAGVGVRYKLPFGPIRADVAFPLNKREGDGDFQLYISIGQSF